MTLTKRILSAFISFSISCAIVTTAFAQTADSTVQIEQQNQAQSSVTEEYKIPIDNTSIPEQLDIERLKAQGFSSRVKTEETDLSEIVLSK